MTKPRSRTQTHSTIVCIDCGESREVRNQDKHQVVRCSKCQHEYRLNRRNELRRKDDPPVTANI